MRSPGRSAGTGLFRAEVERGDVGGMGGPIAVSPGVRRCDVRPGAVRSRAVRSRAIWSGDIWSGAGELGYGSGRSVERPKRCRRQWFGRRPRSASPR